MRSVHVVSAVALAAAITSLSIAARPYLRDPAPGPADASSAAPAERAGARDPEAILLLLDLNGPASVEANSGARFTLTARYSDGTTEDVTDRAEWSVDSPYAAVHRGTLAVGAGITDPTFTVTAWFTDGLSLKASRTLTLTATPDANDPAAPPSSGDVAEQSLRGAGRGT